MGTKCGCKLYYTYQGSSTSTNYYYGVDVVGTTNGGSIHVGHYRNGSYFYPSIRRHNAHGTVTYSKLISGSKYFSTFEGAVNYGNSVFAAVGRVRYGSYYNGYFAQFDANGKLLSGKYKQVVFSSTKNDYLYDVAYDPTYKRFWAAGYTTAYGNSRGWLARIDTTKSNGIGWHTVYGSSTKSTVFYGLGYYGGYLYPVGYTTGGTLGGLDGLVTRYSRSSTSASLQSKYGYKYYGGSGSDIFHDVYVNSSYLYLVGRTTTSSKGSYDAWIVRASRTSLTQYASYKYGGKGYDDYQRVAPWGSGVAVTGRERYYYSSTASSDQMTFALHSSSGSRYRQKLYGSNSYIDQGYGIAYTGTQGGRSYALTGYTRYSGTRGITAQVNESGTSSCGIIKFPGGTGGKSN